MMWAGRTKVKRSLQVVALGDFVVPREITVTVDGDNGHPDLRVHFEVRDGRPGVVDFQITSKPNGRTVRSADVGLFNLDNFTMNVFQQEASRYDKRTGQFGIGADVSDGDWWAARRVVEEAVQSPGRGSSKAELEAVANVYREHAAGAPRRAVEAVFGFSQRTAARRIAQARAEGLLEPADEGRS